MTEVVVETFTHHAGAHTDPALSSVPEQLRPNWPRSLASSNVENVVSSL